MSKFVKYLEKGRDFMSLPEKIEDLKEGDRIILFGHGVTITEMNKVADIIKVAYDDQADWDRRPNLDTSNFIKVFSFAEFQEKIDKSKRDSESRTAWSRSGGTWD